MDCELCGRDAEGGLYLISVEGARMNVCRKCTSHGKIIETPKPIYAVKKSFAVKTYGAFGSPGNKKSGNVDIETGEPELIEDYSAAIKKAREKMGLNHKDFAMKINETENVIRKVELGKIVPTDNLARRIEKFAGVKLLEVPKKE